MNNLKADLLGNISKNSNTLTQNDLKYANF